MEKIRLFLKTNPGMVVGFFGLFLVAVGLSWAIFSFVIKPRGTLTPVNNNGVGSARSKIDASLPKTEVCPINGMKYTAQEKSIWDGRRPATIMVENHADSRPPEGLSKADFIYEAVAEGGITRFLGIFYCGVAFGDVKIAPVRSSRVYYINWASEYGDRPIYVHVGGANDYCPTCYGGVKEPGKINSQVDALGLLAKIGWRVPSGNDYDAAYDSGYPVFYRNPDRIAGKVLATEHTMTVSSDALFTDAEKRGLSATAKNGVVWTKGFVPYKFGDDAKAGSASASDISFDFWSNKTDYSVEWKYDATNNQYLRFDGGAAHTDLEFENAQLIAKNIVVMEVKETGPVDSEGHMMEQNIGTGGNMWVFQNGIVIKGTWSKATRTDRTKFMDESGKEITFVRGVTWVEAIPAGNDVNYK